MLDTTTIHRQWFDPAKPPSHADGVSPNPIVLLHEGLGSVSAWGQFPQALADATGRRVLAYDRPGYGRSPPKPGPWPASFMHDEARTLYELCMAEGLSTVVLVGHSDGATIALLALSQNQGRRPPLSVESIVSLSAHVLVEPICVTAINHLRATYTDGLRTPLSRHHDHVDAMFEAWSDVWVSERFRPWTIYHELAAVSVPVLVIQGADDSYGTTHQVAHLVDHLSGPATEHILDGVDHWPHRHAPTETLDLIAGFLR